MRSPGSAVGSNGQGQDCCHCALRMGIGGWRMGIGEWGMEMELLSIFHVEQGCIAYIVVCRPKAHALIKEYVLI